MKTFVIIILSAILVPALLLFAIPGYIDFKQNRRYLGTMERFANGESDLKTLRVVISTHRTAWHLGRNVEIDDPTAIQILYETFSKARLVDTSEFRSSNPNSIRPVNVGFNFHIRIYDGSRQTSGKLYIGGNQSEGLGFLVERIEDDHWFHGAWDPWPIDAYWFPVFPTAWIENPPDNEHEATLYEIFAFLFFLQGNYEGLKLHVTENHWRYVIPQTYGSVSENKIAGDLVELNSIREFWEKHPDQKGGVFVK